jgi:hypothetical protein
MLDVCPLIYFGWIFWILSDNGLGSSDWTGWRVFQLIVHGVIPAFATFGFYRLWMGIVEFKPDCFYAKTAADVPTKYQRSEPTYLTEMSSTGFPTVDLNTTTGFTNIFFGAAYILLALIAPHLFV